MAIIGIVIAILPPALWSAREDSRITRCKDNLRQLYAGLTTYSNKDKLTRYCSGAYDGRRDGYLNPGFKWATLPPITADIEVAGFKDNLIELPAVTMLSGMFIDKFSRKIGPCPD